MSWHAQLSLKLSMLGSSTIVVAYHMYSMTPLSIPSCWLWYTTFIVYTSHVDRWVSHSWCCYTCNHPMVRDYDPTISLGTADFLVHHIHAFTIHVNVLILLKGILFARSFFCDGPGKGGTCQISSWDHVFLGLFWMYNAISIIIFSF